MSNSSFTFLSVNISQTGSGLISIPSDLAIFTVAMATCIGIGAGAYPSLRAARMTTMLALKADYIV
jgi:ABC-type antimicrobial peptide transport system permease subunit